MNKYDKRNEKFEEKYNKMKVGIVYNDMDFSNVEKFSNKLSSIGKILVLMAAMVGAITIIFICCSMIAIWGKIA